MIQHTKLLMNYGSNNVEKKHAEINSMTVQIHICTVL